MQNSCHSLHKIFKEAYAAKQEAVEDHDYKALLTKAALEIIRLRAAARHQIEEGEALKAKTAESKAEVDLSSLQLQNLLYEKNYYKKEIASCQSFRPKFSEEQIGLLEIEDFKKEAPEHFLSGIEDPHELQLQRLAFEKFQRQELVQVFQEVRKRKEAKEAVIAEKQKYLDDIQAHLDAIREASAPLTKHLQLPPRDSTHQQHLQAAAAVLPLPLYIVYRQLKAIATVYGDPVEVSIAGNDREAIASAQAAGAEVFGNLPKEAQAPSRRSKKSDRKSQPADSDTLAHPLSLIISLVMEEGRSLVLQMLYVQELQMVTVKTQNPAQQHILASLFPGDTGSGLPSETAMQHSDTEGMEYPATRPDRPYIWAQHLAGLDFLPPMTATGSLQDQADKAGVAEGLKEYRRQQRLQTVLQKLRSSQHDQPILPNAGQLQEKPPQRAPKRVRCWEEAVKQEPAELEASKAASAIPAEDVKMGTQAMEEDKAVPEEGELPDI